MTREENKALCERYPFLVPSNRWTGKVVEGFDYSYTELDAMPDGWRKAFGEAMCEEIMNELKESNALEGYRITQIKEKYGSLRWYSNYFTDGLRKIIGKYETLSRHTCIDCGAPATVVTTWWISPYCDGCNPVHKGSNEETAPIEEFWAWFYGDGDSEDEA